MGLLGHIGVKVSLPTPARRLTLMSHRQRDSALLMSLGPKLSLHLPLLRALAFSLLTTSSALTCH